MKDETIMPVNREDHLSGPRSDAEMVAMLQGSVAMACGNQERRNFAA
jgi:hypothetical protein